MSQARRVLRLCWLTPLAYAAIANLAGSALPCGTMLSRYAVARPSLASPPTGSELPYVNLKSPTSCWRPFADLSESEHHIWCSDSDKSAGREGRCGRWAADIAMR